MSNILAWAAGIAGVGLVGYAIYFDQKRCSAPDYKRKIRQNRKLKKHTRSATQNISAIPDPRDQAAMQQYFLAEMIYGEELLRDGDIENGSVHMVLQGSLPPIHFEAVVEALPGAKAMFMAAVRAHTQDVDSSDEEHQEDDDHQGAFIIDDDLE
uniref:Uncharacterized protein n=1 Tax=Ditylenchus dipsaci TaxID=166011 RepID=A0A915CRS1_9BILA